MNSRRSSRYTAQSPTVVQSPSSPSSRRTSFPVTPVIDVDMDHVPFSQSFSGILRSRLEAGDPFRANDRIRAVASESGGGISQTTDDYRIQSITNIREIDPQWEDDDVEEIMVISPRTKNRASFLDLHSRSRMSIPDFDVLHVLRDEQTAQMLLARSQSDSCLYAIKMMRKRIASGPELLKRVRSEQACLKAVTERGDCPFLPTLYKSFQDETRLFMIMDNFPGGSLALHLSRGNHFDPDRARFYASEIVEALAYLHSMYIVHRDVKPENVMIASDGHVVLTNFMSAKMLDTLDSPQCGTWSDCGTHEYQAPEMILGWQYDFAVDCWGFGILLCIMHFGQHPFLEGDELDPFLIMQKRILRGQEPRHPPQSVPLSEWGLIKKCLERNAHLRPRMEHIRKHEYFEDIDWERVTAKGYDAPYIPSGYNDEVDLLNADEQIFHFYEQSDLFELDDSPYLEGSKNLFDNYSFIWDPTAPVPQRKESVCRSKDYEGDLTTKGSPPPVIRNIRSILKSPSMRFPENASPSKPSDFLDLQKSASRISVFVTPDRPRKLRKRRSSMHANASRSSILSKRKSMVSLLTDATAKIAGKDRTPKLNVSGTSVSSATPNLPQGVYQAGRGIGFTYTPPASRSRLSLASVTTKSCFGRVSDVLGGIKKPVDKPPRSRNEVMQQIYGSTWSITHTNEARMSTVTFGIPEGLGRRVDNEEVPAVPQAS